MSHLKFVIPVASGPITDLWTFTHDLGERAANDVCAISKKAPVTTLESVDI